MSRIASSLFLLFSLITGNAGAATGAAAYNFLPLVLLFMVNLLVGGLLFVAAVIVFNLWRERRSIRLHSTERRATRPRRN